jgi:hypothetical protein
MSFGDFFVSVTKKVVTYCNKENEHCTNEIAVSSRMLSRDLTVKMPLNIIVLAICNQTVFLQIILI